MSRCHGQVVMVTAMEVLNKICGHVWSSHEFHWLEYVIETDYKHRHIMYTRHNSISELVVWIVRISELLQRSSILHTRREHHYHMHGLEECNGSPSESLFLVVRYHLPFRAYHKIKGNPYTAKSGTGTPIRDNSQDRPFSKRTIVIAEICFCTKRRQGQCIVLQLVMLRETRSVHKSNSSLETIRKTLRQTKMSNHIWSER